MSARVDDEELKDVSKVVENLGEHHLRQKVSFLHGTPLQIPS